MKRGCFACGLAWLLLPHLAFSLSINGVRPNAASPGQQVEVIGTGFDTATTLALKVNGALAAVANITASNLTFTVPQGAVSGPLTVEDMATAEIVSSRFPFTVIRQVTVTLDPALGLDPTDYIFQNFLDRVEPQSAGQTIQLGAGSGRIDYVFAEPKQAGAPLMAVVTDSDSVMLSARSSALGLAFMFPEYFALSTQEANTRLAAIQALPQYAALEQAVAAAIANGDDYVLGPSDDQALIAVVVAGRRAAAAAPQSPPPTSHGNARLIGKAGPGPDPMDTGARSLQPGFPRNLTVPGFRLLDHTIHKTPVAKLNPDGQPLWTFQWEANEITRIFDFDFGNDFLDGLNRVVDNPLDWIAELYPISTFDMRVRSPDLARMTEGSHSYVYDRISDASLSRAIIESEPYAGNLNLQDYVREQTFDRIPSVELIKEVLGGPDDLIKDMAVPARESGLYLVRAFSGAHFPRQAQLIGNLPGGAQVEAEAFALNVTLYVVEAGVAMVQVGTLNSDGGLAKGLAKLAGEATAVYLRERALGRLEDPVFRERLIRTLFEEYINFAGEELIGGVLNKRLKMILDITEAASATLAAIERGGALSNWTTYFSENAFLSGAVEETLIAVGDPWAPVIESFEPTVGRAGDTLTITGRNFGFNNEQITVVFGFATTDPTNPQPGAFAVAQRGPGFQTTSIDVQVPELARTGPLTVIVEGRGFASTARLDKPFDEFVRLPPPVIDEVRGGPFFPSDPVLLAGTGFTAAEGQFPTIEIEGRADSSALDFSEEHARFSAPGAPGTYTVRVRVGGQASNPVTLVVDTPPNPLPGSLIVVNTAAAGNVRDDFLSLTEALMLAAGQLDYGSLTFNEQGPVGSPGGGQIPAPGLGRIDSIRLDHNGLGAGQTSTHFTLEGIPVTGHDLFNGKLPFGATFSGAPLVITGRDAHVEGVVLQQMPGDAVIFRDANRSSLSSVDIVSAAGRGVVFEQGSRNCSINNLAIRQTGGHGVHITGGSLANVIFSVSPFAGTSRTIAGAAGFGLLIDGDAANNRVNVLEISGQLGGLRITGAGSIGNRVGRLDLPVHHLTAGAKVTGLAGPGAHVDAPATLLERVDARGGGGDGIVLEPGAEHSTLLRCWIGVDRANPTPGDPIPDANIGRALALNSLGMANDPLPSVTVRECRIRARPDLGVFLDGVRNALFTDTEISVIQLQTSLGNAMHVRAGSAGNLFRNLTFSTTARASCSKAPPPAIIASKIASSAIRRTAIKPASASIPKAGTTFSPSAPLRATRWRACSSKRAAIRAQPSRPAPLPRPAAT